MRRLPGNETPIHTYGELVDDVVRDRLERVEGVSRLNYFGGTDREMRVVIDPSSLSRYRPDRAEVVAALREANVSLSAGDVEEGKRRYVVRTEGEFEDLRTSPMWWCCSAAGRRRPAGWPHHRRRHGRRSASPTRTSAPASAIAASRRWP